MTWFGLVFRIWFGFLEWFDKLSFFTKFQPFSIPRTGEKVPGGEIGGAAGARISRPIIVISLESKLLNFEFCVTY